MSYLSFLKTKAEPLIATLATLDEIDERSDAQQADYDRVLVELDGLKSQIEGEQTRETKARGHTEFWQGLSITAKPRASAHSPRPDDRQQQPEFKSWWQSVSSSPQFENIKRGGSTMDAVEVAGIKQVLDNLKAIYAPGSSYQGGPLGISSVGNPPIRFPLLELIPTIPYSGASVPYLPMTPTGAPAVTAWGITKPVIDNAGNVLYAPMQTIAGTKTTAKQSLKYIPGLRDAIERELLYLLELALSDAVAAAILAATTQSATNTDHVTAILAAIATVEGQGLPVNAILIDPIDLATIKAAAWTGNKYMAVVEGNNLLGYPAIPIASLPDGTALVGNFEVGAHLYVGETANVKINDEVNTNNTTLFVAETDAATTVDAPRWFAKAIKGP